MDAPYPAALAEAAQTVRGLLRDHLVDRLAVEDTWRSQHPDPD